MCSVFIQEFVLNTSGSATAGFDRKMSLLTGDQEEQHELVLNDFGFGFHGSL